MNPKIIGQQAINVQATIDKVLAELAEFKEAARVIEDVKVVIQSGTAAIAAEKSEAIAKIQSEKAKAIEAVRAAASSAHSQSQNADNPNFQKSERTTLE